MTERVQGIWANTFPNGRHISMTRRNKVRLAVSWWKAIQSQEWHRLRGVCPQAIDVADHYDPDAIDHLVAESVMREAAIQEFFAHSRIVPLTVTYEDFVSKYEETVFDILGWLGLDVATATVAPPAYEQLADAVSEDRVQRFRRESNWDIESPPKKLTRPNRALSPSLWRRKEERAALPMCTLTRITIDPWPDGDRI